MLTNQWQNYEPAEMEPNYRNLFEKINNMLGLLQFYLLFSLAVSILVYFSVDGLQDLMYFLFHIRCTPEIVSVLFILTTFTWLPLIKLYKSKVSSNRLRVWFRKIIKTLTIIQRKNRRSFPYSEGICKVFYVVLCLCVSVWS